MNDKIKAKLLKKSRAARAEQRGKFLSTFCIVVIMAIVVAIFGFIASHGIATFTVNKVNLFDFLFKSNWNPSVMHHGRPEVVPYQ